MRYFSVCSGIEAASVAWEPLGWEAVGFAEIEPFPSAVLHHRFGAGRPRNMPSPDDAGLSEKEISARRAAIKAVAKIPLSGGGRPVNYGDFTLVNTDELGSIDLLVGGCPCQSFSTAGKRLSLADARGNLTLAYTILAHELARNHGLRWAVYENVPGILSTDDNAFGCFLAGLVGADDPLHLPAGIERWPDEGMVEGPRARAAWRILDAQYFGLAQRRRRVFVVVGFGDGADPAAVLFERQGLRRHPPARGEAGESSTASAAIGVAIRGRKGGGSVELGGEIGFALRTGGGGADKAHVLAASIAPTLNAAFGSKLGLEDQHVNGGCGLFVAHTLRADGFDVSEDGTGRGTALIPVCFDPRQSDVLVHGDKTGPLDTKFPGPAIPFDTTQITSKENRNNPKPGDPCHPLAAQGHAPAIAFTCKHHGQDAGEELAPTLRAMQGEYAYAGGQVAIATPLDLRNASRDPMKGAVQGSGIGEAGDPSYTVTKQVTPGVATSWAVRRLTPTECERLQGFPDGWTDIPQSADGPRYKSLGNSMATNVMRWIGERINEVDFTQDRGSQ